MCHYFSFQFSIREVNSNINFIKRNK
ncbi:hypothetical protein D299_gp164 [Escherichia phage HX01]|nr:hypothetical protein D299_gp164 [Escherichia phage HX01]